ncbi:MAG: DUF6226 family protein [Sporichthyaceae bacterium]
MDSSILRAAMIDAFKAAGGSSLAWASPAFLGRPESEEDFERCLNPVKFRILNVRAQAWATALAQIGLAEVDGFGDDPALWHSVPWFGMSDWVVHVVPTRAGSIPLLFGLRAVEEVPEAQVAIAAGDPAVLLADFPEDHYDAYDEGSAPLLEAFDDAVLTVITGTFVSVSAETFTAQYTLAGSTVEGAVTGMEMGKFEDLFAEARAGTSPYPSVYGRRWW